MHVFKNGFIVLKCLQNKNYRLPPFLRACPDCPGVGGITETASQPEFEELTKEQKNFSELCAKLCVLNN
ncbi:hypothetical protein C7N43_20545 [Sphingobacteriales bacterium UPWRP_1]|nr:hypothetical protein BVG80_01820 [Sphingobacteriales bacterium TSM_CSM]PSJ75098.1 hypothetical protein C7N43_20545 [Sphingobacteriales bacterium UPWRP_1]